MLRNSMRNFHAHALDVAFVVTAIAQSLLNLVFALLSY